jgi:hypothetical protein
MPGRGDGVHFAGRVAAVADVAAGDAGTSRGSRADFLPLYFPVVGGDGLFCVEPKGADGAVGFFDCWASSSPCCFAADPWPSWFSRREVRLP